MRQFFARLRWRQFFLSLVALLLTLAAAELFLRWCAPLYQANDPALYVYDAELGFRLKPDTDTRQTTDFQQESRTNHYGASNFQEDFAAYPRLVFAVGDSYTQGTGLPADANYPFQLDLILNQKAEGLYDPRYGVVNLGVAAYGGEQELLSLQRAANQLRPPEIILYLGCDNDFSDDRLFLSGYSHRHLVAGSPYWGRWVSPLQWLTNDLQLGLRLKLLYGKLRRQEITGNSDTNEAVNSTPSVAEREASVLERLADFAQKHGARLIVSWSNDSGSYDWLQKWAAQRRIPFADWRTRVRSVRTQVPLLPTHNSHSGGHHRVWVNRLLAEEFARQIAQAEH